MKNRVVDDFSDAESWKPFVSGRASLKVSSEASGNGTALRLDFDFRGEGGFVGIGKAIQARLPEAYTFGVRVRGDAPRNGLEFKVADTGRANVWRWKQEEFDFAPAGVDLQIRSSEIDFAWGPSGSGTLRRLGGVEFVIVAGPGGRGTVWIEDFRLIDRSQRQRPAVTASSSSGGRDPHVVLAKESEETWAPSRSDSQPWLQLDFHQPREYGGLIIDWGARPATRSFAVEKSDDGKKWKAIFRSKQSEGLRSFIPLPEGESRYLRLAFQSGAEIQTVHIQPSDFSRSRDDFLQAIAENSPHGWYPRYFLRQQSYWTCTGIPDGRTSALINEEGLIEPDRGNFSLEPFLFAQGDLITWADVSRSVGLVADSLPIPTVTWKHPDFILEITPFATGKIDDAMMFVRYRVTNRGTRTRKVKLFVAIRPHQVSPPWQKWHEIGGVSEIQEIALKQNAVWINRSKVVVPLTETSGFGAARFEQGAIGEFLTAGRLPSETSVRDETGLASGLLRFDLAVPAEGTKEVYLAVPFGSSDKVDPGLVRRVSGVDGADQFAVAVKTWEERLGAVQCKVPAGVLREAARTFRTASGQILITRDGPALQPGPRRYTRSWIRDGAMMGAALLRSGEFAAPADFVNWYAQYQREDGFVPCCVDRSGPDWLIEHDSHGQLIFAAMEAFRFTGDRAFLEEQWPALLKAGRCIENLRATRLTPEYEKPENRDRYGLLPESASHEGYLAQPVHSYWDDFWGVRGLYDLAEAAGELGHPLEQKHFTELADSFAESLQRSMQTVIKEKQLQYIPGSVEWADFDPTATANALLLFPDGAGLPLDLLHKTFDEYLIGVRKRRNDEVPWNNYSAYEIRIIGAMIRLGRRDEVAELLEYYLSDRRPRKWNQWPEISWHNPRSPGHLGDVPHTWIAAEYMLVFTALFAYEREQQKALVLGAGIHESWLSRPAGISIDGLPTAYGALNLQMTHEGDNAIRMRIGGDLVVPAGGLILQPPGSGSIQSVTVNGSAVTDFGKTEVVIHKFPADVLIRFGE